jgi:hypothetical protein
VETIAQLVEVRTAETRGGNTRFVARDADGREYTTFREEIGAHAQGLQGRQVRISYHEVQRGQYTNVYLDEIEPVGPPPGSGQEGGHGDTDPEEAAWRTAVEAAPWLVGAPDGKVDADELYEKLKPFEERVAEDIESSRRSDSAPSGPSDSAPSGPSDSAPSRPSDSAPSRPSDSAPAGE